MNLFSREKQDLVLHRNEEKKYDLLNSSFCPNEGFFLKTDFKNERIH